VARHKDQIILWLIMKRISLYYGSP